MSQQLSTLKPRLNAVIKHIRRLIYNNVRWAVKRPLALKQNAHIQLLRVMIILPALQRTDP